MIVPLNLFMEQVYSAFNKNLTIGDNVTGKFAELSITTPADYATGGFPDTVVPWTFTKSVQAVFIAYIREDTDNFVAITQPVTIDWIQTSSTSITVNYITGLAVSTRYNVRLLLL